MITFDRTTQNITMKQGDYFYQTITFPFSIVGHKLYFTVKESLADEYEDAVVKKVISSHTDAPNGETKFEITSEDSELDAGKYFYDLKWDQGEADGSKMITIYPTDPLKQCYLIITQDVK